MSRTPYLRQNRRLWLDHVLGARGLGLCIYGTLPASLAALGVVKAPDLGFRSALWLPALVVIGLVPIVMLFLLVRQRLSLWYEFGDGLAARSSVISISTLVASTLVAVATGVIKERYEWVGAAAWWALPVDLRWKPLIEGLLLAVVSSIGASTLFLTTVKESSDLPLLPRKDFVEQVVKLKGALRQIRQSKVWERNLSQDRATLPKSLDEATGAITALLSLVPSDGQRSQLYQRLREDLERFKTAVELVDRLPQRWAEFFGMPSPKGLNPGDLARRNSGQTLKELQLDG